MLNNFLGKDYIRGFKLTVTSNSTFNLGSGECRVSDDTSNIFCKCSIPLDLSTLGINGLDVGVEESNTWYYVWVISRMSPDKATGRIDSLTFNRLVDSFANFMNNGILIGDWVINLSTNRFAKVLFIAPTYLDLDVDIFTSSNQEYIVGPRICALLSVNNLNPVMPPEFTKKRRVGVVRNDSNSNLVSFIQRGSGNLRSYDYIDPSVTSILLNGASLNWVDVDTSFYAPVTATLTKFLFACDGRSAFFRVKGNTSGWQVVLDPPGDLGNSGSVSNSLPMQGEQLIQYKVSSGFGLGASIFVLSFDEEL